MTWKFRLDNRDNVIHLNPAVRASARRLAAYLSKNVLADGLRSGIACAWALTL